MHIHFAVHAAVLAAVDVAAADPQLFVCDPVPIHVVAVAVVAAAAAVAVVVYAGPLVQVYAVVYVVVCLRLLRGRFLPVCRLRPSLLWIGALAEGRS